MSSLYGFSMKHIKKSSITKCHGLSLRHHFIWIFHANANKKLATKMPWIKPPISCLYGFVHANANKSSIPKCHEFSIRCHVHMDFSMKMSKKARYQNFTNSAPDVIFNMDLSQKNVKKMLSTKMPWIKHPMSCFYRMWWKEFISQDFIFTTHT